MTDLVVLTGITGFVAKHIAVKLLNAGYAVRGTLRDLSREGEVRAAIAPHADTAKLSFAALDLNRDDGWIAAMQGASALMHTASPFPIVAPAHPDDLIRPAVQGTLRALSAARAAGIRRIIVTSSIVALVDSRHRGVMDETHWCDVEAIGTSAYTKSKTSAERAAWNYCTQHGMDLTTINPGFIIGPPLDSHYGSSISVIARLLRGRDPMLPNIGFAMVDVRDVAEAHVRALQRPNTAGARIPCAQSVMTLPEMAHVLKQAYPNRRITTRIAPLFVLRILAIFDPQIRAVLPSIGQFHQISDARARADLDMRFISSEGALRATAEWLIANGAD
jgi:dihydroflavonol-4-reductase